MVAIMIYSTAHFDAEFVLDTFVSLQNLDLINGMSEKKCWLCNN